MNTTKREKTIKELFLGKCWAYLDDNFHKFSEENKIKIALALTTKDLPQEMLGNFQVVQMGVIQKTSSESSTNLDFKIGTSSEPASTEDTGPTG